MSVLQGQGNLANQLSKLHALDALKVVESLRGRGVKRHLLDLGGDIAGNGISIYS
jgi:hypothetical protein